MGSTVTPAESPAGPPANSSSTSSTEILQGPSSSGSRTTGANIKYRPFKRINCHEPLEYYRPGGYHPVAFQDVLGEPGRFVVLRKLGYGAFGIVWMCWDTEVEKLRAVKIMQADDSEQAFKSEAGLLTLLSRSGHQVSTEEAYKNHLGVPLEHFWQDGPNGRHLCLVMPVLGPGIGKAKASGDVDFLKDVCAQVTGGLAFLHSKGMTHGDLHTGNILIQTTFDDFGFDDVNSLEMDYDKELLIAEGYDGPGPHAPKEIYDCVNWAEVDPKYFKKEVAIIDFGACHKSSEPPDYQTIDENFRAPEQFFGSLASQACDLWALGCTMMHILGSNSPFSRVQTRKLWDPVPIWEDALGPLPQPYRTQWIAENIASKGAGSKRKYDEMAQSDPVSWRKEHLITIKKHRLEKFGTEDILSEFLAKPTRFRILASEQQQQEQVDGVGDGDSIETKEWSLPREEIESAVNLIKSVIKYNPSERTPAWALLSHPFLAGRILPPPSTRPPPPTKTQNHSPERTSPAATAAGTP